MFLFPKNLKTTKYFVNIFKTDYIDLVSQLGLD